jgi:CheY-like chemotaxis protein/anti-sigma regulatory factor (Ser/Thr protein kinase)
VQRILVVDDDRTTRHLITLQLRSAGYAVESAGDGRRALQRVKRQGFDLVLLDVWMPGMDGLELLARLREQDSPPRVVVMTADDTSDTLLRALRQNAYRYLAKPVEPARLLEIVRAVLAAGPELRPIEVVSARPDWLELVVPCDRGAAERIQEFVACLDADLPDDVRSSVGQAFRELLMNAIEWGGGLDPAKSVRISCLRARRMLLYRIADPGQGFRFEGLAHAALANPEDRPIEHMAVRAQKGLRPGGFGLLMTQQIVDELLYNEAQNEVVFVKYLD